MITLEQLEKRVDAVEASLKEVRPADLRRLAETSYKLLEDTRERMSRVEVRLESLANGLALLTASQAEMRGELRSEINSVRGDVANLGEKVANLSEKVVKLDEKVARLDANFSRLDAKFTAFERGLPSMIAETMREVLREQRR